MTKRAWRPWLWSVCAATALTLVGATEDYASRAVEHLPAVWSRLLLLQAASWFA